MQAIFLKALDRLTDPVSILALLLMIVVVILVKSITRHLPELNRTLGKQAAILEHLVYNNERDNDESP